MLTSIREFVICVSTILYQTKSAKSTALLLVEGALRENDHLKHMYVCK